MALADVLFPFQFTKMRRLSRQEIETRIAVKLATADKVVQQRLRSKVTTDRDWARHELAKAIAGQFDNDSSMVIATEFVGLAPHQRPGKWGVDEPPPC
ncbi:MAG: hypothetical protein M3Q19_14625 [Pseudomonadota bacterium]|nr:hypothetical protein [Pseudomonadota bacterium]